MANTKSAKKNILINLRNRTRNVQYKTKVKSVVKKAQNAISSNAAEKSEQVRLAIKTIDQIASKGILHKKAASRKKSSLAKALNKSLNQAPAAAVASTATPKKTVAKAPAKKVAATKETPKKAAAKKEAPKATAKKTSTKKEKASDK